MIRTLLAETKYFQTNKFQVSYPGTWASGIHANWQFASTPTAGFGTSNPTTAGCGVTLTATVNGLNTASMPPAFCISSSTQGSFHHGGAYFALCDGSVAFVTNNIGLGALRNLGIRNDGNPAGIP